MSIVRKIHHVAYRCNDAKETALWYEKNLGMKLVLAIAEDQVPSTKDPDPYMHLFMDAGGGNILAFFEIPKSAPMGRDPNTPNWVQHIAFEVGSLDELNAARAKLEANGVEVLGITDHTIFQSIYFRDPNGHRLELAVNTGTPDMYKRLDEVKWEMVEEWARTRRAPKHAAWMHEKEFATA
jgi:catechol 2,3-dioxygenase-like lactoylglutathione lyase family enzyme